ncbi:MAG: short subunit dehydrogenase-like uncharacterized protein [Pseudohongiellaceae bacterium]
MNGQSNKEFDLIVFGATSFVGKILCNYLVNEYREPNLTWAIAGRSEAKLNELKQGLGARAANLTLLLADSSDEASLAGLCSKTSVIISTVGPYALYGELLVKCCAQSGTDYCDLTGEPHWIRRMIQRYEAAAKGSGARIVHSCGFDSIPSDLGVMFLQNQALKRFGSYCPKVKMRVMALRGGASGGTIASGINLYKEQAKDPALVSEMQDYYSICPRDHESSVAQHTVDLEYDEDFNAWAGPFIMAGINTRIVLRSNAIRQSGCYSADFHYDEGTLTGSGAKGRKRAKRLAFGTRIAPKLLGNGLVRSVLTKFVLPKPGQGPSPKEQLEGFYDLRFIGVTQSNQKIRIKVTGDRDPGYGSTAKMLTQAALSLHRDVDKSAVAGGFWTPATVFDEKLLERLRNFAGMRFELDSEP